MSRIVTVVFYSEIKATGGLTKTSRAKVFTDRFALYFCFLRVFLLSFLNLKNREEKEKKEVDEEDQRNE